MKQKIRKAEADSACHVDKEARVITISGDIALPMASKFRRVFKALEREAPTDIHVEINTPGGDEYAGMLIVDTIMLSRCPVITRATGMTMSMGACILAAGTTRECLPMTSIMVHQGSCRVYARLEEFPGELSELLRWEERLWQILDERTGHEAGFWKALCAGRNKYLDAKEALELRLIDRICTKGLAL